MTFYLGTHKPYWLWRRECSVPLFVSRRQLVKWKRYYPAFERWGLDSGGFSELSMHGRWVTEPQQYVDEVERMVSEIGRLDLAAIQDWMCEPQMLAKTGLTVEEHQQRTVENYLLLRDLAPHLPWAPVLQGWEPRDYWAHVALYFEAGVDLTELRTVGIGSVCRRQHTEEVEGVIRGLAAGGLRIHGFGFKTLGLARVADSLASADSLAWSIDARYAKARLPGCSHKTCANCMKYALLWRQRLLRDITRYRSAA